MHPRLCRHWHAHEKNKHLSRQGRHLGQRFVTCVKLFGSSLFALLHHWRRICYLCFRPGDYDAIHVVPVLNLNNIVWVLTAQSSSRGPQSYRQTSQRLPVLGSFSSESHPVFSAQKKTLKHRSRIQRYGSGVTKPRVSGGVYVTRGAVAGLVRFREGRDAPSHVTARCWDWEADAQWQLPPRSHRPAQSHCRW